MDPNNLSHSPREPRYGRRAANRGRIFLWGTVLMLAMLVMLGLTVQSNFARLENANRWNVHTYRVLERIDKVSTLLDAQEAHLRGFALTGSLEYLRQLERSDGIGVRALGDLRALTSDRREQQDKLAIIEPEYHNYKQRFVRSYMAIPLGGAQVARAQRELRQQTASRGRASRQLQLKLNEMQVVERKLLETRARDLASAQREATRTLVGGGAFVVLLAIVLCVLLARAVRAQQAAIDKTSQLNQSLVGEIGERRIAEELLRSSEASFRHLAEDSLDMICRHAPDGTLTYVSPAARPLLGYDPAEMVGVHPRRFLFDRSAPDSKLPPVEQFAAHLRDTQHKPLLRAYRHAGGHKVWLEVVGHAIVAGESGEILAWHTSARDVSARVREETERSRLLAGLRAVVEIADDLIGAPNEEELLKRAVEMMHRRLGLKRCSIYLSQPLNAEGEGAEQEFSAMMRGAFGTDENGVAVAEDSLFYNTCNDPDPNDITPAPGERWIVRRNQPRYIWRDGARVELPTRGWLARTPIATRHNVIGLFFHDSAPTDAPHDAVDQQLVAVFCSLLGALLERGRSQLRMNRQQRLLESLMENAPLFLYSVDKDEKFTLATGSVLPILGLNPGEMLGQKITQVMPPDAPSVEGMRRTLRGETMHQELEFAGRWLKMWRQPIRDSDGQINGMIGIGMDITQQQHAQRALKESEARYRQVADTLQDVLFQTDDAANWTFLNPAWSEITGYSLDQSLGKPSAQMVAEQDQAEFAALIETVRLAQSGDVPARVLRFKTNGGELRWLEVALRANFASDGAFRGTAGTLRDVTDKVRAEDELREALEINRAILQGASYAIVSTDENGVIQTFNPAAESLFGLRASEVVGQMSPTIFHDALELQARAVEISKELGQNIAPGFETLVARARRGGDGEAEWTCLRADGSAVPMRISYSVLRGPNGDITGYVSIGYDLTETRRAEKLKNEFVSVVSHELRTPLTSIRGAIGLLLGGVAGELPQSALQMLDIAQKNAGRLVLLINDILDIEKIESGKMRFEMAEIPLSGLLQNALEGNRGYAQTLDVSMELEPLPPALIGATLLGDEARLQQVMSNLLSNACKWTPRGSRVRIKAGLAPSARAENPRVSIEVGDEGPGVPLEFEAHLFERFAQADGSATREKGGTGLGLAVTQAIIEKHGGTIAYRAPDASAGRVGATFHFELAARNVNLAECDFEHTRQRFLVIEGDEDVAALLRAILEDAQYQVEVAHSRARALEIARASAGFDGIALDLHLPDGHGFDLLEELRALPALSDVPIIIVSSFYQEREPGAAHQIEPGFEKPVQPENLLSALAAHRFNAQNSEAGNGKARILHIEDDDDICRVVAMILGDLADVVNVSSLAQARTRLLGERFDLALLDIGLPDGNGLDLIEQLSAQEPPVPTLIFSAREEEAEAASHVAAALIKSRTPNDELRATVEELLQG